MDEKMGNSDGARIADGLEQKEEQRQMTLLQIVEAAGRVGVPLRIDRPGFARIVVDLQEELGKPLASLGNEIKLGISSVSF